MKCKLNLLYLATILLVACTANEPELPATLQKGDDSDYNFISLEEALDNADDEFSVVFGETTRSGRKVKTIEIFKARTRTDTNSLYGFYIVNFDSGFAMLSADRRRPKVYALSENGSLHLSDTINNRGLNWYINEYAGLFNPNIPVDTTININPPKPDTKQKFVISEPLIKGFMTRFHQRSPYNTYCKTLDGEQAVTGCVPLAVGTVMGYYKWPESYQGYQFNWSAMYSDANHLSWARLFEIIGRPVNVNATYGTITTSASPTLIPRAMTNMGYKSAQFMEFDKTRLDSELETKNPVLCGGSSTAEGHRWVIDGGYIMKVTNQANMVNPVIYYSYYHCLWGWEGWANGYFLLNSNPYSIGGTPDERDENTYGSADNYTNLSIVCGYRPNK